ncbi:MAG: hypothetical protein ACFNL7_09105, partial [Capnocytophaga granulosa]
MGVGSIVIGCGCFSGVSSVTGFSAAGVSLGEDGGSHQSVEDVALMRAIPGM